MSGSGLLAALLCAAVGLALANASVRTALIAIAATILTAVLSSFLSPFLLSPGFIVVGAAIGVLASTAAIYAPRLFGPPTLIAVAVNAGFWAGEVLSRPEDRIGLALALAFLGLCLPAMWMVRRKWQIGLKVVGSWILAIAVLSATLNTVSMPSYQLDHME